MAKDNYANYLMIALAVIRTLKGIKNRDPREVLNAIFGASAEYFSGILVSGLAKIYLPRLLVPIGFGTIRCSIVGVIISLVIPWLVEKLLIDKIPARYLWPL